MHERVNGEDFFAIRAVAYDADGNVHNRTVEPYYPRGKTLEELREDFQEYAKALDAPVVDWDGIRRHGNRN
jgi:hypothetical protein